MNEILMWSLRLVLGALLVSPFIGAVGFALIDRCYSKKMEHVIKMQNMLAEALKVMNEELKKQLGHG